MCDFIRQECVFYRPQRERDVCEGEKDAELQLQKNNDKSKFVKRGSFRYWLEKYDPAHSPADRRMELKGRYVGMSREDVAELVKERFGVAREYNKNQQVGLRQLNLETFWSSIRSMITLPPELSDTVEGVQNARETGFDGPFVARTLRRRLSTEARDKPDSSLDTTQLAYRCGDFDVVKTWAEENWKEVALAKKAENEGKSRINYRERMEAPENQMDAVGVGLPVTKTPSNSPPEIWTEDDDSLLRELKGDGKTWKEIVAGLGGMHRSVTQAKARWKEIDR